MPPEPDSQVATVIAELHTYRNAKGNAEAPPIPNPSQEVELYEESAGLTENTDPNVGATEINSSAIETPLQQLTARELWDEGRAIDTNVS